MQSPSGESYVALRVDGQAMKGGAHLSFDTCYGDGSALVISSNVESCIVDVDLALISVELYLEKQVSVTLKQELGSGVGGGIGEKVLSAVIRQQQASATDIS